MIEPYVALLDKTGLQEALVVLNNLRYDQGQGYIFTYDLKGLRLQSGSGKAISKNFWNNRDKNGNYITQNIIKAAQDGSGYTT